MKKNNHHKGGNYLLRDIPLELLMRAKHFAVDEQTTLREVLIAALREYLKKK